MALPFTPATVAVIVELPGWLPVTTPLEETVATPVLELDHDADCEASGLSAASESETLSCCVPPATRPIDPGVTDTWLTAPAVTRIEADALFPSALAVIVTLPTFAATTTPLVLTVATLASEVDQPTERPVSALPLASAAWAVSCVLVPDASVEEPGVTERLAIAAVETSTVAVSPTPLASAMIRAVPAPTPVTTPDEETVANRLSAELQTTVWPGSARPVCVATAAESCTWPPTEAFALWGERTSLAGTLSVTMRDPCPATPSLVAYTVAEPIFRALT